MSGAKFPTPPPPGGTPNYGGAQPSPPPPPPRQLPPNHGPLYGRHPVSGRPTVAKIGAPTPAHLTPESMVSSVLLDGMGMLAQDPTQHHPDVPEWAIDLMNQVRSLTVQNTALKCVLMNRYVITQQEMDEAVNLLTQQLEKEFRAMVEQLTRHAAQQPNTPPPADPRRAP